MELHWQALEKQLEFISWYCTVTDATAPTAAGRLCECSQNEMVSRCNADFICCWSSSVTPAVKLELSKWVQCLDRHVWKSSSGVWILFFVTLCLSPIRTLPEVELGKLVSVYLHIVWWAHKWFFFGSNVLSVPHSGSCLGPNKLLWR